MPPPRAFTLAEVLITLGIIGVVAALTMPSIINKSKQMQLIAQAKKTYSTIANALILAQNDLGSIGNNTALFDQNNTSIQTARQFVKYFKDAKLCETASQQGCSQFYYNTRYAVPQANDSDTFYGSNNSGPAIILTNGAVLRISQINGNTDCSLLVNSCKTDQYGRCLKDENGNNIKVSYTNYRCGYIRFDVNGIKGPNRYGEDNFGAVVALRKLEPEPWNAIGYSSLRNILSGKNKLEFTDYQIGGKIDN